MIKPANVFVAIALLAASGQAWAGVAEEEEVLIRRGIQLRKARDDLSARAEFVKAYELTHSPRAAAQLGLADFALGRWDDAEAYVSEGMRTPGDPFISKYRVELDKALATIKAHVARVEVIGEPVGAEIFVNGRPAGRLPLAKPVAVSEGQVDVEVKAPGFVRGSRTVTLSGGQYQRMVIRLEREGVAASTATSPSASTSPGVAAGAVAQAAGAGAATGPGEMSGPGARGSAEMGAGAVPPTTTPADSGSTRYSVRGIAKWTSLGLAGAALATGITASIIHQSNISEFEGLRGGGCFDNNGRAVDAAGNPVAECQPSLNAYRSARTWQIVGFAGAGVFATTWLVLMLTEPSTGATVAAKSTTTAWTCVPTLTVAGAACAIRF